MSTISKFTLKGRERIIAGARIGVTLETSARAVGVTPSTVWRWRQRGLADLANGIESEWAEFAQDLMEAEAEIDAQVEASVIAATSGDWRAGAWWLSRKKPEQWSKESAAPLARKIIDAVLARVQERCPADVYEQVCNALDDAIEVQNG